MSSAGSQSHWTAVQEQGLLSVDSQKFLHVGSLSLLAVQEQGLLSVDSQAFLHVGSLGL